MLLSISRCRVRVTSNAGRPASGGGVLAADLADTREALDHLAMQMAAVTGAQSDRMTRDAGWRLLTVGRLLERLSGYAQFLLAFAEHGRRGFPRQT